MDYVSPELPPSSALAQPIVITIPSVRSVNPRMAGAFVTALLQVAHRLGTVALLAGFVTGYFVFAGKVFYVPLAIVAGCAVVGFSSAVMVLSLVHRGEPQVREAVGVGIFNAVIGAFALAFMLVARAGVIQDTLRQDGGAIRAQVQDYFQAPQAMPPPQQ
jgi:hypothetical protein